MSMFVVQKQSEQEVILTAQEEAELSGLFHRLFARFELTGPVDEFLVKRVVNKETKKSELHAIGLARVVVGVEKLKELNAQGVYPNVFQVVEPPPQLAAVQEMGEAVADAEEALEEAAEE